VNLSTPATRVAFVSSTVVDLEKERSFVKSVLQDFDGPVRFATLLSEDPTFPVTPRDLATQHAYQICLDKVGLADYFILLIKNRYGTANIDHEGDIISITHREYREAYRRRLPIFTFVDSRTWKARNLVKSGKNQRFVPLEQVRVFDLIDEIARQPRSMWMYFYRDSRQIRSALNTALFGFDDSSFVADVTVPDGTVVRTGAIIEKVWEIKNSGCVVWDERYLKEENEGASGLTASQPIIAVPRTAPGAAVQLRVELRAPAYPATCESYWKMTLPDGRYAFPKMKGLYCRVKVIY
jgi:hypothetical protein